MQPVKVYDHYWQFCDSQKQWREYVLWCHITHFLSYAEAESQLIEDAFLAESNWVDIHTGPPNNKSLYRITFKEMVQSLLSNMFRQRKVRRLVSDSEVIC
jgi:hypothetical protein